ncbi:MAG: glycosyltransferase family 2 protein [bacterium]
MKPISVLILARNEEPYIERFLQKHAWADELVVVDTGSTDRTAELARKHTPSVYRVEMAHGFAWVRNFGTERARHDWILKLDVDEEISEPLHREISEALARDEGIDAYSAVDRIYFNGKWIRGCGWYPRHQIRLFDRRKGRWEGIVHEFPAIPGPVKRFRHHVDHYSYRDIPHYFEKFNLYTSLDARKLREQGFRLGAWRLPECLMGRPLAFFLKAYLLRRGFADGFYGLVVSAFSSFYVFVKYAKLYELQKLESRSPAAGFPASPPHA